MIRKSGGLYLFRAFRGLPKYGPTIKYLSEPGIKVKMQKGRKFLSAGSATAHAYRG